jgi:hypothetical protein
MPTEPGSLTNQIILKNVIPNAGRIGKSSGAQEAEVVGQDKRTGAILDSIAPGVVLRRQFNYPINPFQEPEVGVTRRRPFNYPLNPFREPETGVLMRYQFIYPRSPFALGDSVVLNRLGSPAIPPVYPVGTYTGANGGVIKTATGARIALAELDGEPPVTPDICNRDPGNTDVGPGGGGGGGGGGGNFNYPPPTEEPPVEPPTEPPEEPPSPPGGPGGPSGPGGPGGPGTGCTPEDDCQWYSVPSPESPCPPGTFPKGFIEAPVGVFRILCCGEAPPPGEGCGHLELKWSCSEQGCVQVPGGQYNTQAECIEACQISYNCVQGICQRVEGLSGEFSSYEECSANGEYIAEYSMDNLNWTVFATSNKPISISAEERTEGGNCCGEQYEVTITYSVIVFNSPGGTHTRSLVHPGPIKGVAVGPRTEGGGEAVGFIAPFVIFGNYDCDDETLITVAGCSLPGACQFTIIDHSIIKVSDGPDCFRDLCTLVAISDGEVVGEAGPFEDNCPKYRVRSLGCGV